MRERGVFFSNIYMFFFWKMENGKWKDNFKISIKDIGPGRRKEMEFSPFFPRVFFERKERKKYNLEKEKVKKKEKSSCCSLSIYNHLAFLLTYVSNKPPNSTQASLAAPKYS